MADDGTGDRDAPRGGAREVIWGDQAEAIERALRELDPELAELVIEVAYDRVFEAPGLDLRTRELLALAHLMAVGSETELETHVRGALNAGASLEEVRETVRHGAMFLGFPRALAAMKVVRRVAARLEPG